MEQINLTDVAGRLPEAWGSALLGKVGGACLKVLRMDGRPLPPESHPSAEALLVLDGRLELEVDGRTTTLGPGALTLIPAGALHSVRPGSSGTLVIVEVEP